MQITRATEYAVRCALHLALEPPGRVVPRREIAAARAIPEQFLGKIAQRMARAAIIHIHQGARGGYELVVPADRLTLLQVVEAAEGDLSLNNCVMHPRTCSRTCVCAAHRVWAEARRQLRATLAAVTFAELAAQEGPVALPLAAPDGAPKGMSAASSKSAEPEKSAAPVVVAMQDAPGAEGARRGGLRRLRGASTAEVRSDKAPEPARLREVSDTSPNNKRR